MFASTAAWLIDGGTAYAQDDQAVATAPPARVSGPVDPRDARIHDLQRQLEAQRAQLDALAEQLGDLKTAVSSGMKDIRDSQASADKVVITGGKPSIQSADGRFTANLKAVMQFDAAAHFQDDDIAAAQTDPRARDLNDGTNFRRARIGIDGKAFGDFNYAAIFDFGGSGAEDAGKIQDLWIEYAGKKPFRARVGAFAPSLGMEDAASTNGSPLFERPAAAEAARNLAGGERRIGAQLFANGERWLATGAVTGNLIGSLSPNASSFGTQNYDEQLALTGRFAGVPLKGENWLLHLGVNASHVINPPDLGPTAPVRYGIQIRERPELTVDTTRLIDTGVIPADGAYHLGLELGLQRKNLFIQAEAFHIAVERSVAGLDNPGFRSFYVQGGWTITKQPRVYSINSGAFEAPKVEKPFDLKTGDWGAWELVGRYSWTDLNDDEGAAGSATPVGGIRGGEQSVTTVGINWFPNGVVRFSADVFHVEIDRLNAAGLRIGQDYNALAVRSQFSF